MKFRLILVGLLLVIGVLASRWYLGQLTESPLPSGRVDMGLRTQAAIPSISPIPALPEADNALMDRAWFDLPSPPEMPGIIHDTGPFVDADPNKAVEQPPGPPIPVQNAGAFVDVGGPPIPQPEAAGNVQNREPVHIVPPLPIP